MASYSTDDQFFADVAKFIGLLKKGLKDNGVSDPWLAECLLKAAIAMTSNGVFTSRRAELATELLDRALNYDLNGVELTPEYITNFLAEKNARKKPAE